MMSSFSLWLKRLVERGVGYALALCVVLAVLGMGAFVLVRPSLLSFVNAEIKRYGVEAEASDISMLGNIRLNHISMPLQDGGMLTAGRFSGRPPVLWMGGTASLYDVVLKKEGITVAIPELHLKNVSPGVKDPAVSSREMQFLMRISAVRVAAPEIDVTVDRDGKRQRLVIRQFALDGFRRGIISRMMVGSMDCALALVPPSAGASNIHSGAFSAENIDAASAYALLKGKAAPGDEDGRRVLAGPVELNDLTIDFAGEKSGILHVAAGMLRSAGLALKPAKTPLVQAVQALLATAHDSDHSAAAAKEKKKEILDDLRDALENLAAIDAEIRDLAIENANLKIGFSRFELKSRDWNQVLPYGFSVSLQGLTIDAARADNEYARLLHDMGYDTIHLSVVADMLWNPADRALILRNIAFSGKDLGELSVQGKLLDFDDGFFSGDGTRMLTALEGAAIAELDMTLADRGIIDRFIDWETTKINVSRKELKDSIYEIAVKSPPLLLKNYKNIRRISDAFGAFVQNSGTLRIRMTAREREGISLSDLAMAQNGLSALLDRVNLAVSTEEQPS